MTNIGIDKKSSHYDEGGISVMDVIKAKLTPEQFEGFLLGNIIKYSLRANFKGSKERDFEKIGVYQRLAAKGSLKSKDCDHLWVNCTVPEGWAISVCLKCRLEIHPEGCPCNKCKKNEAKK